MGLFGRDFYMDKAGDFPCQFGLLRSRFFVDHAGKHIAQVVALACEGPVWQRTWGLQISDTGKPVELRAPHVPAPIGAWLGNYGIQGIDESVLEGLLTAIRNGAQPSPDGIYDLTPDFKIAETN